MRRNNFFEIRMASATNKQKVRMRARQEVTVTLPSLRASGFSEFYIFPLHNILS